MYSILDAEIIAMLSLQAMVIQKRVHEIMATCLAAAGNHEIPLTQAWTY